MKMKLLTRTLSFLAIASLTLFFANCGDDGGETPAEKEALENLKKDWSIQSVDLDGTDRSADFTNFKLLISGDFDPDDENGDGDYPYDFSVSGSRPTPNPWPATGDWEFATEPDSNSGLILRNDGTGIQYSIDGDELTLTFNFTGAGYPGARTSEVEGNWTFIFN